MKKEGIYVSFKTPPLKAPYIEGIIFHLKRRLFIQMRLQKRDDWPNILPNVIDNWNGSKHPSLGFLGMVVN